MKEIVGLARIRDLYLPKLVFGEVCLCDGEKVEKMEMTDLPNHDNMYR